MTAFAEQKKAVDLHRFTRCIIDSTAPNNGRSTYFVRSENRYNRAIPVLLAPWLGNQPDAENSVFVLTKDISDQGLAVLLGCPFRAKEVVVGFWLASVGMEEPWFFRGTIVRNTAIGGGFRLLGMELTEFMNDDWASELRPLLFRAKRLLPPATVSSPPESARERPERSRIGAGAAIAVLLAVTVLVASVAMFWLRIGEENARRALALSAHFFAHASRSRARRGDSCRDVPLVLWPAPAQAHIKRFT